MKIALLSNVNVDYVSRILSKQWDVIPSVGYGDIWGALFNPESELRKAKPDRIVFLPDIEQMLDEACDRDYITVIGEWFQRIEDIVYENLELFISDVTFRSRYLDANDSFDTIHVIHEWNQALEKCVASHANVHALRLDRVIEEAGKRTVFSDKMWYMGKIPYSQEGCQLVVNEIDRVLRLLNRVPAKVLVLDLDNTLWGGILGEEGVEGIILSDDHIGAIYKKVQRSLKAIEKTGVLLAIASKNNEDDVQEVWEHHPHMLLRRDDFTAVRINWDDKAESIQSIAKELNLGLDSFVFIDDMAGERDNIRKRLPEVTVPEFPAKVEAYPAFVEDVYHQYFEKIRTTAEDLEKTRQYAENAKREEASRGMSYEDFLDSLQIRVERVALNDIRLERVAQLHGKTNQFNLTTIRYTRQDLERLIEQGYQINAYHVKDRFGDYGLVAAVVVRFERSTEAEIKSFLMSCRIMGKQIEDYVIDDIEKGLLSQGIRKLRARYIKTAKNKPVENLYDRLGYAVVQRTEEETLYEIDLASRPGRKYFVNREDQI